MIIFNNIGGAIRLSRYRQCDLARKIGMSPQQVSALVGARNPTMKSLARVAVGLGCTIDDLVIVRREDENEQRRT